MIGNSIKNSKLNQLLFWSSTVYPGFSEEVCVPIIEKYSNLKFNKEFYFGYSPERINPGKSKYKLYNTNKIISASNLSSLKKLKKFTKQLLKRFI